MSKYKAKRTKVDGITFASKLEAKRYSELKVLENAGIIESLECHPAYELHAPGGQKIGKYIADFRYRENGAEVIEDTKGFKTDLYRWKKKHVEAEHGIEVREIS